MTTTLPTLPKGFQRSHVEAILREIGPRIGLTSTLERALFFMMGCTRPGDWTDTNSEPIYYGHQGDTARSLCKSDRTLRRYETELVKLGLVEKRVKANGQRSSYGACGICFSKIIARIGEFLELREKVRAERALRRELRSLRSTYLRMIKQIADDKANTYRIRQQAYDALSQWIDARKLNALPIAELQAHVDRCREEAHNLSREQENTQILSAKSDKDVRPIQDTIKEKKGTCNQAETRDDNSARQFDSTISVKANNKNNDRKLENFIRSLTTEHLSKLASDDLRMIIIAKQTDGRLRSDSKLIEAVHDLLPLIGIDYSAWESACHSMSVYGAALATLVIDANRAHPTHPVKNPGGALRAMTKRYNENRLNLAASLWAIDKRRAQEQRDSSTFAFP